MKHTWVWALAAVGCGGGGGGEPQTGSATVMYGSMPKMMTTGSAIKDPKTSGNMRIQMGTDNVTCSTDLDATEPPAGTYLYFSVPETGSAPTNLVISMFNISGNSVNIFLPSGSVQLTSPDTGRVAGTLMFMTTDSTVGDITMTGDFDVKKCF